MVSGDHLETARRVAVDSGLLDPQHTDAEIMTAAQFRELIGGHKIIQDRENN